MRVIVTAQSRNDARDAAAWYESQRAGLGDEFLLALMDTFASIRQWPRASVQIQTDVRRMRVTDFPYYVFYRLTDEEAEVLAVYHCSRKPDEWRGPR